MFIVDCQKETRKKAAAGFVEALCAALRCAGPEAPPERVGAEARAAGAGLAERFGARVAVELRAGRLCTGVETEERGHCREGWEAFSLWRPRREAPVRAELKKRARGPRAAVKRVLLAEFPELYRKPPPFLVGAGR